jgi:iron(III) transport system substrate-binding protein
MPAAADSRVVVYSAAERRYCAALLDSFAQLHPDVEVEFYDGISTALHRRYLERSAAGSPHADLLWSSAMDLQMELVLAGRAAPYRSAHADSLPDWAVYRDRAYATTLEPLVTLVDRSAAAGNEVESASQGLIALLGEQAGRARGRVACLDIESNGLGFLALVQLSLDERRFRDYLSALAACSPRVCDSQRALVAALASGEASVAIDLLGAYAERAMAGNPALALAYDEQYVPAISRIALVCADAPHREPGKRFLDFLLSANGQQALEQAGLFPLRGGRDALHWRPIAIADGMVELLDSRRRQFVLRAWREAVGREG